MTFVDFMIKKVGMTKFIGRENELKKLKESYLDLKDLFSEKEYIKVLRNDATGFRDLMEM